MTCRNLIFHRKHEEEQDINFCVRIHLANLDEKSKPLAYKWPFSYVVDWTNPYRNFTENINIFLVFINICIIWISHHDSQGCCIEILKDYPWNIGWDKPTCTLVSWKQGFRHPTRNKCMGWFAQISNILRMMLLLF